MLYGYKIEVTTVSGGGNASLTAATTNRVMKGLPYAVTGAGRRAPSLKLYAVEWIDGDFADGVDAVLSVTNTLSGVDTTLLTLTNADNDKWYFPRVLVQGVTGTDLTAIYDMLVVDGTLKLTITNGGNGKTGGCVVYLEG